jgi:hypothetical protein
MNQNDQEFAKDFNELKAWKISEEEFPSTGSNKDKLKFFINYAILAPSGHNTQPWLFDVYNNIIVMYADRTRALPVVDPEDRELTISCGAALSHLLLGSDKIVFCILYFALSISSMNTIIFSFYKEDKQKQMVIRQQNMQIHLLMARRQVPFQGITLGQ